MVSSWKLPYYGVYLFKEMLKISEARHPLCFYGFLLDFLKPSCSSVLWNITKWVHLSGFEYRVIFSFLCHFRGLNLCDQVYSVWTLVNKWTRITELICMEIRIQTQIIDYFMLKSSLFIFVFLQDSF